MVSFWYIKGDFLETRSGRIGASDIPKLIPNPEKPTTSLAGYDNTPITVYQEKTGIKAPDSAGIAAEMGHYLEPFAVEWFIRTFCGAEMGRQHMHDRESYEFSEREAGAFQNTPFHHHVQYYTNGMICHPDAVYKPQGIFTKPTKITKHGITVDMSKPFLIEAKFATYWAGKREEGSVISGYDFGLNDWQGIPFKHFWQCQFQMALLEVDVCYLVLCYPSDPDIFFVWRVPAIRKRQAQAIDLAGRLLHCIETRTPPGDLAMNAKDIMALYPDVLDDFVLVDDEEREQSLVIARTHNNAVKQSKRWQAVVNDSKDAMSVMLRDRPEIRDREGIIGKWGITKGSERIMALSEIKATNPLAYKYLAKRGLLYTSEDSRTVKITWKGDME